MPARAVPHRLHLRGPVSPGHPAPGAEEGLKTILEATRNLDMVAAVGLPVRANNKLYNSAQVGQVCEFKPGLAIMISTTPTETRIQPNNPNGCVQ